MTDPRDTTETDADDVERHPWPRCGPRPGSPCRSRSAAAALARRRVNVLWALLRDGRRYELTPPSALTA
ncbi:hypothetical protein ACJWDR_18820 [Streptomyces tauricus]|uniref:hypothetical protein n=1 Tax=Streptomyces tauricus TaxID=68274 RepID=UPI00387F225A